MQFFESSFDCISDNIFRHRFSFCSVLLFQQCEAFLSEKTRKIAIRRKALTLE